MKASETEIRRWKPARPRFNSNEIFPRSHYQMGIAPVLLVAGRFLLPFIIGGGTLLVGGKILEDSLPKLGIDTSRIPLSALLGGIGSALMVGSNYFPESIQPALTVAGIAGIAGSIAVLFIPKEPEQKFAGPIPVNEQVPQTALHLLPKMLTLSLDPLLAPDGLRRDNYSQQDFEFTVRNNTKDTLSFLAGLHIYRALPSARTFFQSKENVQTIGRKKITLSPGEEKTETLKSPALDLGTHYVVVELFRKEGDGIPFMVSDSVGFEVSLIPWG